MPLTWTRENLFTVTKAYADRYDAEVNANLPEMLALAEDRMSRIMRNREMTATVDIIIVDGQEYYDLPSDFAGLRDIKVIPTTGSPTTLQYITPEQANNVIKNSGTTTYYNISANKLRIVNVLSGEGVIELLYYQRVPPLTDNQSTNWILKHHGDIYKTAMMAEVEIFVKNDPRAVAFSQQLQAMFDELDLRDNKDRWSGTPLATRLENVRGY